VSDSFVQATPYRLKIIIAPLFGRSMVYHGIHPVDLNRLDSNAEANFMKGLSKTPQGQRPTAIARQQDFKCTIPRAWIPRILSTQHFEISKHIIWIINVVSNMEWARSQHIAPNHSLPS